MSQYKTLVAVILAVCVSGSILFADGRQKPKKDQAVKAKTDKERIADLEKRVMELEKRLKKLEQANMNPVTPGGQPIPTLPPQNFWQYRQPGPKIILPESSKPKSSTNGAIIMQPPGVPNGFPAGTKPGTINGMTYYIMPIEKK